MRDKGISARERILARALEMYNEYGIEYVGVRELAKELDIKPGNITYYFPAKDDLVSELAERLAEAEAALLQAGDEVSIYHFLDTHRQIYLSQYKYRSLYISLPLLLKQDNAFAARYKERHTARVNALYHRLKSLFLAGYFQTARSRDMDTILHAITTTNHFWLAEATIDGIADDAEVAISTSLFRLAGLLHIIASEKGREDIKRLLQELDI